MTHKPFTLEKEGSCLRLALHGSLKAQDVQGISQAVWDAVAGDNSVDLLVDMTDAGVPDKGMLDASLSTLRRGLARRVAVYGPAKPGLMAAANQLLHAGGNDNERIKIFRDEELARKWLHAEQS